MLGLLTKPEWVFMKQYAAPKDNLETRLRYYTKCQSRKREIIQLNIYKILLIVNQVIYTLDTICEPNIMTLAQGVLKIFCSQGPLWVKCISPKRGITESNFDRILWKVNQVIMYQNCMPDVMTLAQAVLQIFCSQGCFTTQNDKQKAALLHKMTKLEKGDNSVKYLENFAKS